MVFPWKPSPSYKPNNQDKYKLELKESADLINKNLEWWDWKTKLLIKKLIFKYALWIEKQYLQKYFYNKKIDEKHFKYILYDIDDQIDKISMVLKWTTSIDSIKRDFTWSSIFSIFKEKYSKIDMYIIYRARYELAK